MLLRNHAHQLPHSAHVAWLQAASKHKFEDSAEPAALLWKLRFLQELAVAWPAALTSVEADQSTTDVNLGHLEASWKVQSLCHAPFSEIMP